MSSENQPNPLRPLRPLKRARSREPEPEANRPGANPLGIEHLLRLPFAPTAPKSSAPAPSQETPKPKQKPGRKPKPKEPVYRSLLRKPKAKPIPPPKPWPPLPLPGGSPPPDPITVEWLLDHPEYNLLATTPPKEQEADIYRIVGKVGGERRRRRVLGMVAKMDREQLVSVVMGALRDSSYFVEKAVTEVFEEMEGGEDKAGRIEAAISEAVDDDDNGDEEEEEEEEEEAEDEEGEEAIWMGQAPILIDD